MPARFLSGRRSALVVALFVVALGAAGCINQAAIHDFAKQANTSVNRMQVEGDQPVLDAQQVVSAQYLANLKAISDDPPECKSQSGDDEVRNALSKVHVSGTMKSSEAMAIEELGQLCLTTEPGVWPYYDIDKLITKGNTPFQKVLCGFQRGLIESIKTMSEQATSDLKKAQENLATVPALPEKLPLPQMSEEAFERKCIEGREAIARKLLAEHINIKWKHVPSWKYLKKEYKPLTGYKLLSELSDSKQRTKELQKSIQGLCERHQKNLTKFQGKLSKSKEVIQRLQNEIQQNDTQHQTDKSALQRELDESLALTEILSKQLKALGNQNREPARELMAKLVESKKKGAGLALKIMVLDRHHQTTKDRLQAQLAHSQTRSERLEKLITDTNGNFQAEWQKIDAQLVESDKLTRNIKNKMDGIDDICAPVINFITVRLKAADAYDQAVQALYRAVTGHHMPGMATPNAIIRPKLPPGWRELQTGPPEKISATRYYTNKMQNIYQNISSDYIILLQQGQAELIKSLSVKTTAGTKDQTKDKAEMAEREIIQVKAASAQIYMQAYQRIYQAMFAGDVSALSKLKGEVKDYCGVSIGATINRCKFSTMQAYFCNSKICDASRLRDAQLAVIRSIIAKKKIEIATSCIVELRDISRAHQAMYDHRRDLDDKGLRFKLKMATKYLKTSDQWRRESMKAPSQNVKVPDEEQQFGQIPSVAERVPAPQEAKGGAL